MKFLKIKDINYLSFTRGLGGHELTDYKANIMPSSAGFRP